MKDSTQKPAGIHQSWIARLRFSQKLILLSAVFVVPTALAVAFLVYFTQIQVNFAQKERQGVVALSSLGDLALAVQQHGLAVQSALANDKAGSDEVSALERRANGDVSAMDDWMAAGGGGWGLSDKWTGFKAAWRQLQQRDGDGARNFDDHTKLANQLADMIGDVSDTSNITLDPEMASYTLGDVVVNQLPEIAANYAGTDVTVLGDLKSNGAGIISNVPAGDRTKVAGFEALGNDAMGRARADIDKGGAAQADVLPVVGDPMKKAESTASDFANVTGDLFALGETLTPEQRQNAIEKVHSAATGAIAALTALGDASNRGLDEQLQQRLSKLSQQRALVIGSCLLVLLLALGLSFLVSRNLTRDVGQVTGAVERIAKGDYDARARLGSNDEIGGLARALDNLLDERLASLQQASKDSETLNNSVVLLLQAVAQLSRRDLTVKVPVREDVTGALADALNQLTTETSKVLQQVTTISADVSSASQKVKQQSDSVVEVSENELKQVEKTAEELSGAATAMNEIAQLAQACNAVADNAIKSTQAALQTVNATVGGINSTRDTIRETEKRIKRLGERSQEISSAVNLINTIAERTHILALNASMHAASAGEAGRGFAVVAEEVQRLAESARQATAQITTLVNNIQVETADTVNTMNEAISQVVQGSKLAEQAGVQMQHTQETTADLVRSVQEIASSSQAQAKVSNRLLERAGEIRKATQRTNDQLVAQSEQTTNLVEYAKNLVGAVRVFKLIA